MSLHLRVADLMQPLTDDLVNYASTSSGKSAALVSTIVQAVASLVQESHLMSYLRKIALLRAHIVHFQGICEVHGGSGQIT